ncbi:Disease resistance protein [Quillaja saponaria]|uniref:Disease resistance protein n=1 Tax=Quillaja saponaria TaxID=32244 RepID=A0AAD7QJ20_QUISA|nr:Disease resistance protein [Quillaja saponaria]
MVGELVLSAFLEAAFNRLFSLDVVNFLRGEKLQEDLLKKLKIKLLSINGVINDAEKKQMTDPNVKAWLVEVIDAVYESEDILDEIETEASKTKSEAEFESTTSKVRNFLANVSVNPFERKMKSRVQEVLNKLEYLASQVELLELKKGSNVGDGVGGHSSQRLPSSSFVDQSVIYGRDDDKEKITELLLCDDIESGNHPSVITIVGMGGLGKTTLAQLVYNDKRIEDQFGLKAWVCVSEEFDVKRVTRAILEEITLSKDDATELNTLQRKLKEKLMGNKFLIVLDDVWNENKSNWEVLQSPFNYGAPGSKILVTTRSKRVALTIRCAQIHYPKELAEEDCWTVFATHAFGKEDCNANPSLEPIGRKIVAKCKGLPLALKTLGGLLYTKLSAEEWETILASDIWNMPNEESNIIPALILSYHYLPSHLKRCFAYCSLFPKDYEFEMEDLVLLWMAENFLQISHKDKRIEDVGNDYFHDLLSRCFFQQSSSNRTCFVMHDLLNDLAKFVSGEFCFRLEGDKAQYIATRTRHFSYLQIRLEVFNRFDSICKANRLRTFLLFGSHWRSEYKMMSSKIASDLSSTNKSLRSLSLSGYFNMNELSDSIGNLKYLRYMNLSWTRIKRLPDSTCQLYNLQTLKLYQCELLEELPLDMHKLVNLRHLNFVGTKVDKMPTQLGKLKNLQTLTSFYCSGSNIKELGQLNNLRGQLSLMQLQNVVIPMDAAEANMENKKGLETLELGWSENNEDSLNERTVLEKLKPHTNLKNLTIRNYSGTRLPDWFADGSLSTMVSLELSSCKYCFSLPPLGQLPSLKKLSISGFDAIVAISSDFYGSSPIAQPFGSLEILEFEDMAAWEEWCCFENHIEAAAFTHLQELHIENCPKLKGQLPQHLPCLTELVIDGCHELASSIPMSQVLQNLELRECKKLLLKHLPSTLHYVGISGSGINDSLLGKILINNPCLTELSIINRPDMELPMCHCYTSLLDLTIINSCNSLCFLLLNFFPKLQELYLERCKHLESFSNSEEHQEFITSLNWLEILSCPKFVSFGKGEFSAPKLEWCRIAGMESLKSLPEQMHVLLPSLAHLTLEYCPLIESFPEGGLPSKLKYLTISGCSKLIASRMDWGLCRLHSLLHFYISCGYDNVESFPEEGLFPTSLSTLFLSNFRNLKSIHQMGLHCLTSLKELCIHDCPNLQGLPDEGLPKSLSILTITGNCPLLAKRCQKEKGEDWHKIACIPLIRIEDEIVT